MTAQASRTLGAFNVPAALPVAEFDSVNERVARSSYENEDVWYSFATAWNAIAYRMRSALDHERAFTASVTGASAPPAEERYRQDHDLFGFAVSALSAIECFYFAAFRVGSVVRPSAFPASEPSSLKFDPREVTRRFLLAFPGDALTDAMRTTLDATYEEIKSLRNFLAHRGTPSRMSFFSTTGPDSPSTIPSNLADLASSWRYDLPLTSDYLVHYKVWLESSLEQLIKAASAFVSTRL